MNYNPVLHVFSFTVASQQVQFFIFCFWLNKGGKLAATARHFPAIVDYEDYERSIILLSGKYEPLVIMVSS